MMYVYLDESGDLGFSQRSTRYLTIAFVVLENPIPFGRCVRKIKKKYGIPRNVELKAYNTKELIKSDLLNSFMSHDMEFHAITVKKSNVEPKLRRNTNILYNYTVGLLLVERILKEPKDTKVVINVDRRIIKVPTGFNFNQYLINKIWYENERSDIDLNIYHLDSSQSYAIQGIDVVCNSIFRKYNSTYYRLFNIIKGKVKSDKRLFFNK
jgi:hypothetical protein